MRKEVIRMDNKFKQILEQFDKNQIRQINSFLNSKEGMDFKDSITKSDKERLIAKLSAMDANAVKKTVSKLSAKDISDIIEKFR